MMNRTRHEDTCPSYVNNYLSEERPKRYSSTELKSFTSDFSESNSIGSGGFAEVYKGLFPSGELRAVKVLNKMNFVEDTFMAEVRTMGNTAHRNLVKLCGYCFEDNMKALVYEYMENGSLDKILYEDCHGNIKWVKLYSIAIDIANGLKYLHHELDDHIIHHDIKAANVLLDKKFSAKIADFGLARIMKGDVSRVDLSVTRGTPGYNAPETWMLGSKVTFKCDVYSFGMMLFEVMGKRKNGIAENWFPGLVWNQFENENLEHFIITRCGIAEKDKENANILCKVALWCVQDSPDLRPSMKDVVLMLEKEKLVQDPPCPSSVFMQAFTPRVDLGESRMENIEREWLDKKELDLTYPRNIIASQSHALVAGNDDGITQPQLKSNKRKTRSPNREEDLETLEPNKGMKLPTTKLVGKTTALKYKERILELIAKDEAVTIGIYGMGGVGKTTIFKNVHNQLLAELNRFDIIIWVTVSKDGNTTKLQNDLAKELDLNLSCEDDVLRRSRLLFQALERRKRVVFFFDDMWKKINLDEIGIPEPTQENGFKLILTTRLLEVCQTMGCHEDNTIKVEPLPVDEAWELFMKKVDHVLTPEVKKIAKMVAKKCSGLPLAIITVGATMRKNSDINKWAVALEDLNSRDTNNQIMDIKDDVFKCLKFSYDRLENEKQRKCFLCCALYPEDWKIETRDLVDFWIMDGLVEGTSRQNELVKGQYILNKLKDHCLLETVDEVYDEYYEMCDGVKMHDLVREMALRLTNKCFLVKGPDLKELPNEEEWEIDLERASFMNNEIEAISISPICPKLSTLILTNGGYFKSVTHDFFVHMKCLKVLDLRSSDQMFENIHLKFLPDSISDLVNLRALRLSRFRMLKKLPSLANLVLLRRLEFTNSTIQELPEGMEMLVNLRCLNLHKVQLKERIPIGLISKLSALQELYLGGIELDKLYEVGRGESFAKELLSLRELENLRVTFRCLYDYCSYVGSPKFKELNWFYLTIGKEDIAYGRPPLETTIYVSDPPDEHIALVFPKNTKDIELRSFHDVIWLKDVRELVTFRIGECNNIECIWTSKDENQEFLTCWLRSLEVIQIDRCTNLYTIFEGIPNYTSGVLPIFCLKRLLIMSCHNLKNIFQLSTFLQLLQNLEQITIINCNELKELIGEDEEEETETTIAIPRFNTSMICFKKLIIDCCNNLKNVFSSFRLLQLLQNLEEITVRDCNELEELIGAEEEETETPIAIPRLKSLIISDLPKLNKICRGVMNASNCSTCWLQSLERILIGGCSKLYTIFEEIPNYTSGVLPVFCLKELEINYCNNLKNVFSSSRLLQLLQNLEQIIISKCDELEDLIGVDEEEESETPTAIPRLKYLWISKLPKLKRIWRGVMICESLEQVEVYNCCELKRLPRLMGKEQLMPPALRSIDGSREWWGSLEWDPAYPKSILEPFFIEKRDSCFNGS